MYQSTHGMTLIQNHMREYTIRQPSLSVTTNKHTNTQLLCISAAPSLQRLYQTKCE